MDADGSSSTSAGRAARIEVDLALETPAWLVDLPQAEALARRAAVAALDRACPGPPLALAVVLADDDRLHDLNRTWRGVDRPTNVLAFPSEERRVGIPPSATPGAPDGTPIELGDVVIARTTMCREAAENGCTLEQHVGHLVVHGTLHLLGYDHEDEDEALIMEALEREVLAMLGIPDPYA